MNSPALHRNSTRPFFSADGLSLFFVSYASNLAERDLNQTADLFKVELLDGALLAVIQMNITSGGARLIWQGQAEKAYRVQVTDNLESVEWKDLSEDIRGDHTFEIQTSGPRRFYRIVEQP